MDGSERIGSRLGMMHAAHGPHALDDQAIVIGQSIDFCNKTVAAWTVTSTQLTFLHWQLNDERAMTCDQSSVHRYHKYQYRIFNPDLHACVSQRRNSL